MKWLKRYWLFVMPNYYPGGGMTDLVKSFDDMDEAMDFLRTGCWSDGPDEPPRRFSGRDQWYQILDSHEMRVYRDLDGWTDVVERPSA